MINAHKYHFWCTKCGAECPGNNKLCGGASCIDLVKEAGEYDENECKYAEEENNIRM